MAKTVLGTTAAAGGAVFAGTLAHNAAENLYPVHNNEGGGEGNGGNGGNGGGGGGGGAGSYPVMAQTYPVYANAAPAPASVAASTNNNSPMVPNGYVIYNNQLYTIEQYVQQLGYVRPAPQVTTPGFSG
ncbi:hypothetical protein BCV70DRAFT_200732 [Testicularia cyperi]|uniref:Uncharacterized protein n=1 Tax=Testicularia cyperi TaxID=1882483 RepID=A0A317XNC3_9BASI|nr:hypothetical protein BCV70DRAFT_200732 [Testicularia cyperi]